MSTGKDCLATRRPSFTPPGAQFMKNYNAMVDYKFLAAQEITINQAPKCPWQFFVTHPDLKGKICWYPSTGSAVREEYQGEYAKLGKHHDAEELTKVVYEQINA